MAFSSDAAFEFKTSFMDRVKDADPTSDGQIDDNTETPTTTTENNAQQFKSNWVDAIKEQGHGQDTPSAQQQASSNNAAAIMSQDMAPTQEKGFDTAKWGYNAGSAPKYESMDSDVQKRVAGLDYSVQQDRNYWAAKADVTRAGTFGDVWKMEPPTWKRPEDPEEIKTTWQDEKKDEDK